VAPVLLDNRGLLKVGVSMVLALIVVFGGGFITGYQKAVTQQLALTQDRGIELPSVNVEQAETLAMVLASQPPAIEEAGASIDVDDPDNIDASDDNVQKTAQGMPIKGISVKNSPQKGDLEKDSNVTSIIDAATQVITRAQSETSIPSSLAPLAISGENVVAKKMAKSGATSDSVEKLGKDKPRKDKLAQTGVREGKQNNTIKNTNAGSVLTQVSKLNARYSIQVGMYGRRVNASNLVTMLEAQGLDAYISEYLNKKQQLRYNVRFGYFENKRMALKGLKHYTDNMDGNGYLVKLKRTMHAENNRSASSAATDKTAQF